MADKTYSKIVGAYIAIIYFSSREIIPLFENIYANIESGGLRSVATNGTYFFIAAIPILITRYILIKRGLIKKNESLFRS